MINFLYKISNKQIDLILRKKNFDKINFFPKLFSFHINMVIDFEEI